MNPVEQLRTLREKKGWSRAACAVKIGTTPRTLRAWEEGTRHPKPIVLRVITQFLRRNRIPN
jgi:transcriptional regulator with XRE-family HTH domain